MNRLALSSRPARAPGTLALLSLPGAGRKGEGLVSGRCAVTLRRVVQAGALGAFALGLAGCGPDVAGAAAGGAAVKAAEVRQAQEEKARVLQKMQEADKAQQERLKEMDREIDSATK